MKVALAHDWLNGMRGGEKCLEVFCELYPESPIYTLFYEEGKVSKIIARHPIHTSFIQRLPKVFTHYRRYLPFFSRAIESFRLNGEELVISTSHCVAKGIRKPRGALHVCYCFTPVRYVWGLFDEYFGNENFFIKLLIRYFLNRLRAWDKKTASGVDRFVAISHHVKNRIGLFYDRQADVIYPPVDTEFYCPDLQTAREDFFLLVSALVPYKRVDLALEAFNRMGRTLVVIGDGPQKAVLKKKAQSHIQFLGWQSDKVLRDYYRRAAALVFPGEEDFGIVPLEMQACGGPVIAYGHGGALETVTEGTTGLFFHEPSSKNLEAAVREFEKKRWDPQAARDNALRFSKERFRKEVTEYMNGVCSGGGEGAA